MTGFESVAVFGLVLVLTIGVIALQVTFALPRVASLRTQLATCPQTRAFRYTIRETVVTRRPGAEVIELALRPRRADRPALPALRAAA